MMPSERTFFNKAIYKRALSRFWIIGAAYAVVLCFLTLMCGQYFNSEFTEMSEYVSYSILSNLTRREILAAAAAAVVMYRLVLWAEKLLQHYWGVKT